VNGVELIKCWFLLQALNSFFKFRLF